jgi:hypothetical protein
MISFLDRYQMGEYRDVWDELLGLGELRHTDQIYKDAQAVAQETMRRARYNIELLIPRLQASGYEFGYSWLEEIAKYYEATDQSISPEEREWLPSDVLELLEDDSDPLWEAEQTRKAANRRPLPLASPGIEAQQHLAELDHLVGTFPLSLRTWYEFVGTVDFVGTLPQAWKPPLSQLDEQGPVARGHFPGGEFHLPPFDPLFVQPLEQVLNYARGSIKDKKQVLGSLPIAPDSYGKYWTSGSGPYRVIVPNAAVDGELLGEWHQTTFVNYLRICFRWAGLPGLTYFATERGRSDLQHLTEGLLSL